MQCETGQKTHDSLKTTAEHDMERNRLNRYCVIVVLITVTFVYIVYIDQYKESNDMTPPNIDETTHKNQYLVYSSKCRIPDLDPWNPEAMQFYEHNSYVPCTTKRLLTYVMNNGTTSILHIDKAVERQYSLWGVTCCYSYVDRSVGEFSDKKISFSDCTPFEDNISLNQTTIMVICNNKKSYHEVYRNTHVFTLVTKNLEKNSSDLKEKFDPPSVLIVGIDSISRLNMQRSLSKTHDYLRMNNWLEYKGYNKIEDNTFPNLMAIFTGQNFSSISKKCNPAKLGLLDKCNFIWNDYKRFGFITAYAEDEFQYNTFNYLKKGFQTPPTDMYYTPYILASETLPKGILDRMTYCTGPETSGERILNAAKDFAITLKRRPSFGFFWMTTFSHDRINSASRMDEKLVDFFETISMEGILENSIVIFLSDHGARFGNIRLTRTGWLEERLPFLYFSIPKRLQQTFPNHYENLRSNADRLTTPYDLHMTLQDVLIMSGLNHTVVTSEACPNCQTLFQQVEKDRSCENASVEMHWCTCTGYNYLDPNSILSRQAASYILEVLNEKISANGDTLRNCVNLKLNKVISSSVSDTSNNWYKNDTYILLVLNTIPETILEATVSVNYNSKEPTFKLEGTISRLDYYKFNSECLTSWFFKMYCYCQWNRLLDMNFFNYWFEI